MSAEKLGKPFDINPEAELAISVKDGVFQWETADPVLQDAGLSKSKPTNKKERKAEAAAKKAKAATKGPQSKVDPSSENTAVQREPFKLSNINLEMKPGELIGVVGAVGSGKSSLLAALVRKPAPGYRAELI